MRSIFGVLWPATALPAGASSAGLPANSPSRPIPPGWATVRAAARTAPAAIHFKTFKLLKSMERGVAQTGTKGTKGKEGEAEFANNGEPQ